jgi:hypothetical protein
VEPLGAAPAHERDIERVRVLGEDHGVVRAVAAGDRDAALVDEVLEAVDRVLGGSLRQAVLGMDDELVAARQHAGRDPLVEGEAVDPVVAASWTVEAGAEPTDANGVHAEDR